MKVMCVRRFDQVRSVRVREKCSNNEHMFMRADKDVLKWFGDMESLKKSIYV